jgi:hypothetical protein
MRDIVLIAPAEYGLNTIKSKLPEGCSSVINEEEGRLVVKINNSENVVEFARDDSVSEYYDEPEEINALAAVGASPRFFLVHFKDIEQLKLVLLAVANRPDVIIDNDFGLIELGDKFAERCKASPGWDWVQQ